MVYGDSPDKIEITFASSEVKLWFGADGFVQEMLDGDVSGRSDKQLLLAHSMLALAMQRVGDELKSRRSSDDV